MATMRGMDGSLSLGTTAVGEIFDWTLNTNLAILEDTVMGDAWVTNKGGLGSWSGTARARFDYGDTAGQKAIIDEINAAIPQGDIADIRFRVSATKYFSGAAIASSIAITAELQNIIEATFTFTGNGSLLPVWS